MQLDRSRCIIQRSWDDERYGRLINAIRPLFCLPLFLRRPSREARGSYRRGQSSTDKAGNPACVLRYQRWLRPRFSRVDAGCLFLSSRLAFCDVTRYYTSCSCPDVFFVVTNVERSAVFPLPRGNFPISCRTVSSFLSRCPWFLSKCLRATVGRTSKAISFICLALSAAA